jgi:hypothetical protein
MLLLNTLNSTLRNPIALSINQSFSDERLNLKYRFGVTEFRDASSASNVESKSSAVAAETTVTGRVFDGRVEITNLTASAESSTTNNFKLFFSSERNATLICDHLGGVPIVPSICIPLRYSKVESRWIGESSYRNVTKLLLPKGMQSSFGFLAHHACNSVTFTLSCTSTSTSIDPIDEQAALQISCWGLGGWWLIAQTRLEDIEDFVPASSKST